MWNGFWKLTLMVSVIGVGLFAVYQAQKGMNRVADSIPADNSADDQSGQKAALEERALPFDPQDEEPKSVSVAQKDHERLPRKSPRTPKNPAEQRIDLVSNITTDLPPLKTALATGKLPTQVATGKRAPRQTGLSFREDEEQSEETTNARTGEPQQLPDDDFLQEVATDFPNRPPRQVSENVIDNVGADLESAVDPFADDAAPATGSTKRENVEPGRARLTTNVGDETDFPRSKRAINGAGRKAETPAEVETNSFDSDLKSNQSQQPSVSDFPAADGLPALGTPEPVVGSTESGPFDTGDILPATPPGRLPSAPLILPSDEPPPTRSLRSKTRSLMPGDLESEPLETPPLRSREPQKRSVDQDRVMPVDMVGDGVAGDASQRGIQQPRVTIEKVAQQQAVLEQPLVYTIIVKNTGTVDALNVVIEDRIPKGTELLGTSPRAELAGKRLIWNEPVLKPNEEKRISIKVVPKQEGPIGSVARVYFATEVSAEIQVAAPQLEFVVKAPREVRIGQTFDLVFNLKNVGKVEANNISVRDIVPDFLKHEAGTDIECPIGKLAPNEAREIVLPVTAIKTGNCVNRAVLTADSGIKKELDSAIDVIGELLVLTRTGHNRLYVERPAVFTNNIRNDGNLQVSKVRISEVVPTGMEFETASDGGKYDSNLKAVVWTLGPLAPGDDKAVTVKYVPKETGTLAGKITATGATGSTAAINSSVEVIGKPELQMETLSATGVVTVGERITSKFQLKNAGTAAAHNVQLRVRLPRELRLVSVRGTKFQQKEDTIVFEPIEELAPRMNAAFELILEPIEEADARISLEISADHLTKPHRREEEIQIARDALK